MNNINNEVLASIDSKTRWSQLAEIVYISDYITKSDQISVSMVCKYYRYHLNSIIFNKLALLKDGVISPFSKKSNIKYKNKLQILIKTLNIDLKGVRQYVKILELCDGFNIEFISDLLSLFPSIRVFKVYSLDNDYDLVNLVNLLSNLKHLKGVELSTGYYDYPMEQNDKIIEFFKTLNSLKFILNSHLIPLGSPFLKIDQSFTKLNTLTILDDSVLANLQFCLPSLTRVELPSNKLNEALLTNFIKLNPQLKRMECKWHQMELQRLWSPYTRITRKMSEFKSYSYHCLFLTILHQYNIKYILNNYMSNEDLYINILEVTWTGKDSVEVFRIYHTKFKEIDWNFCKRLSNVLVFKYNYYMFFELDGCIDFPYDNLDWNFVIN